MNKKTMKVLHLIDSGGLYGAEKMLLTLVAEQIKQGLEPMILSAGEPGIEEKAIEVEAKRLNLPVTPWRMKPGLNVSGTRDMLVWASEAGYQLLHSHGYKFNILLGMIPKRVHGARTVSTVHGYTAVRPFSKLRVYQLLDKLMLKRADAIVVVSEQLRSQFGKGWQVEIIPNGIEEKSACDDSTYSSQPKNKYLIAVGRISEEKAYDRLIEAFCELGAKDLKLVIVGEGDQRQCLESLVEHKGFGNRIEFAGYVRDPASLIKNAEALVISSITEGLPLVLLEAMRAGTPVVSTPVGEIPKVLGFGDYGVLAQGCRSNDLRDALENVLENNKVARGKAAAGTEHFLRNYTAANMANRYSQLYKKLGVNE